MNVDGTCFCGAIKVRAEVDPEKVTICHCTDCQQLSGTAFRVSVPVPENGLEMTGEPSVYVKTAESGAKRAQGFCGTCGSPIFSTAVGEGPKIHILRTGILRQRDQLPPHKQIWCDSVIDWLPDFEGVPKVQKQS